MGMVVAENENEARKAAVWLQENAINWHTIDQEPVLELDDAIEKGLFFPDSSTSQNSPSRLLKVSSVATVTNEY